MTQGGSGRRRWLRLAGVVLVLVVLAAFTLPFLLDVERYRDRIEGALNDATGWSCDLGEIRLSVLRGLALTVQPATLRAPQEDSRFDVETIEVRARLLPLLRGRLEIESVDLEAPRIVLVRPSVERGWVLPFPGGSDPGAGAADAGDDASIEIATVRLRDGAARLEDRSSSPPLIFEIEQVDLQLSSESGELSGRGVPVGTAGELRWQGRPSEPIELSFDALPTELFVPWVGADLVRPGGKLSGIVEVDLPDRILARLTAEDTHVLAGEAPFEAAVLEAELRGEAGRWRAESLAFEGAGARLVGSGSILPVTELELSMDRTPLEDAVGFARRLFPFPLDLEPPGFASVEVDIRQPEGGEMTYEARGEIEAASFNMGPPFPPVEQARTRFGLTPAGELVLELIDGTVAGGALRGVVRLDSIVPLGSLTFDGNIVEAGLGRLVSGFVEDASGLRGPATVRGQLAVDLAGSEIDLDAIGGRLELAAGDVRLPGWDIEAAIREQIAESLGALGEIVARLEGKQEASEASSEPDEGELLFQRLSAVVDLGQRPWSLESFELDAGDFSARGAGTFDPAAGRVDLAFEARLDAETTRRYLEDQPALEALVRDDRLTLPLSVEGPLVGPSIRVDTGGLVPTSKKETVRDLIRGLIRSDRDDD